MASVQTQNPVIRLKVDGITFVTTYTTLSRYSKAKLFRMVENSRQQQADQEELNLIIDRNADYFKYVLDLHRVGALHLTQGVCWHRLREEIEFWELDARTCLSACCAQRVLEQEEKEHMASYLESQLEQYVPKTIAVEDRNLRTQSRMYFGFAYKVWLFLEDPTSSLLAQVWGIFFLFIVLVSVFIQVAMSHPIFRRERSEPNWDISNETNPKLIMFATTEVQPFIWRVENFNCVFFLVEIIIRFGVCPNKPAFFKSIYNWVDFMCVTPMVLLLVVQVSYVKHDKRTLFLVSYIFSALGVFRILRLFKLLRHFLCVRVLLLALKASIREIALLMLLLMVGMLLFSNLIYFAELHVEDQFETIPIGFWWAIVTMTTVGYGDKHPKSSWGYVVGAMCAICGMLLIGIPIPAIANNFNLLYAMARRKRMLRHQGDQQSVGYRSNGIKISTVSPHLSTNGVVLSPSSCMQTDTANETMTRNNYVITES